MTDRGKAREGERERGGNQNLKNSDQSQQSTFAQDSICKVKHRDIIAKREERERWRVKRETLGEGDLKVCEETEEVACAAQGGALNAKV